MVGRMPSKAEVARARAAGKLCPWCGEASQYESGGSRGHDVQLIIGALVKPTRFLLAGGYTGACVSCGEIVNICPHCDTPNRAIKGETTCRSCKENFI